MKTKFIISIFLLLLSLPLMAQNNYYYYYKGQKKYLTLDKSSADISVKNTLNKSSLKNSYELRDFTLVDDKSLNKPSTYKYAKITFQNKLTDEEYFEKLELIKSQSDIRTVSPNFRGKRGKKIGMSDYLYVKLKEIDDYQALISLASQKKLSIIEQNRFMPLWYTLRCTENTVGNTLEIANLLFETGLFASAVPDLLTYDDIVCANDDNFGDLWGLNNSNNQNIDINACDAWLITEGAGVNVGVIDQGIEFSHNDLSNNLSPISYDTESNSSPSQTYGDHGVHCAGTIGAIKDNSLQVVGVAPKSTLFSISNSLGGNANSRIKRADGINWAVQNGIDIINNSWSSGVQFDIIDDAIDNALINGRNGLGTIMVFAVGNDNSSPVSYPANYHPDILAVGSITSSGSKSSFSNIGEELDIVAPGSSILSTGLNNSITTKSGTSMAAPHVVGIAALILSVNPNLTVQEVNRIIESTAKKIGAYSYSNNSNRPNGTWNVEMGYGLVDAYASVKSVFGNPSVSGSSMLCYSGNSYSISNLPADATISWTTSSSITRVSNQGSNPCTFRATGSNTNSNGIITANITLNGHTISVTKSVDVGTEPPLIGVFDNNNHSQVASGQTGKRYYCQAMGGESNNANDYRWIIYPPSGIQDEFPILGNGKEMQFIPNHSGYYNITLSYKGICGWSTVESKSFQITDYGSFMLYPNPTSREFTVEAIKTRSKTTNNNEEFEVTIYNQMMVQQKKITSKNMRVVINVSNLNRGIYYVQIRTVSSTELRTLVIE